MIRWPQLENVLRGNTAFTVYTPDTIRSRLSGEIDAEIRNATGLQVQARMWIKHTEVTADTFYGNRLGKDAAHLVRTLLLDSPNLLTIWEGPEAFAKLNAVKGCAHPANAALKSIRGKLWCDNSTTNLLHVADDLTAGLHELAILQNGGAEILGAHEPERADRQAKRTRIAHSGIFALYELIQKLDGRESDHGAFLSPFFGQKRSDFFYLLKSALQQEMHRYSPIAADTSKAYFSCDEKAMSHLLTKINHTPWERFVLRCGMRGLQEWTRKEINSVVSELDTLLGNGKRVVSGSCALLWHGLNLEPSDIDIRCDIRSLRAAARNVGVSIIHEAYANYSADVVKFNHHGWNIEFVGPLCLSNGSTIDVDNEMISRAKSGRYQSLEDLIAEYLAMARDGGVQDLEKANRLYTANLSILDLSYLADRIKHYRLDLGRIIA